MKSQSIAGYLVIEKIKEGSVGPVWRVTNSNHQVFAIKQMSERNAADPDKVRRFEKEAALTRKLVHPGILKVFERLDVDPPAFRMEYFDSENLKYALWNASERVVGKEFRILRQVAEALAFVHEKGIVHKDVKPENVLVGPTGEARLIDFSLAQTKIDRLLQLGKRVEGTPLYMAPEQIRGEKADPRSDLYSFGVLTYELLTRRPPFLGTTQEAILDKHLKEAPPPLRTWVPTLSADLDALVLKMLAKRKEDRCPDMGSALHELAQWERRDTVVRVRQVAPLPPPKKK